MTYAGKDNTKFSCNLIFIIKKCYGTQCVVCFNPLEVN